MKDLSRIYLGNTYLNELAAALLSYSKMHPIRNTHVDTHETHESSLINKSAVKYFVKYFV